MFAYSLRAHSPIKGPVKRASKAQMKRGHTQQNMLVNTNIVEENNEQRGL